MRLETCGSSTCSLMISSEYKQFLKRTKCWILGEDWGSDGSFIDLHPRDVDGETFCERGPTYRNRLLGGIVPPPSSSLLVILRHPHRNAAVSSELSANFSSLITKQEREYVLCHFLQTFNGTRRLRQACCISLTRSRRHGLLRAWFGAPVVPRIFTHRVAMVRAFRSVRATWWVDAKLFMASYQILNPFVSLQMLPSCHQTI